MKILIADDEDAARYALTKALRADRRVFVETSDGLETVNAIRSNTFDLVILDLNMPQLDGIAVLETLAKDTNVPLPEIIVLTANDSIASAIECIRLGAVDYLTKPYDVDHIRSIARRAEERVALLQQVQELQSQVDASRFGAMIGISPGIKKLFHQIGLAAKSNLPVLIRGESGTGKELVARELHARSDRHAAPFVAVNTAAISESLIESELFGHRKGAFTGADRNRDGVFVLAHGGTLFLDEIGDMPLNVQTRLLRVVQESIVQPVGTTECVQVDVRVMSATHQNLEEAIECKVFREDLYYRLKGIEITIPPLRRRPEDIMLLIYAFLGDQYELTDDAISKVLEYQWPGNVRELKQRVQSAAAMTEGNRISGDDLGLSSSSQGKQSEKGFADYLDLPLTEAHQRLTEDFDRIAIQRALDAENGNITLAAKRLGIHRQSLQQKMKCLGIR